MTQAHEHDPAEADRLTAEEVGARVGAILGAAEREAREIIASARREAPPPPPAAAAVPSGATIDDLARALERLSARFDAFELATAARIEALAYDLGSPVAAAGPVAEAPAAPAAEEAPAAGAARVRAIDLALAGWTREAIANELSVSMPRGEVEALLDQVLAA